MPPKPQKRRRRPRKRQGKNKQKGMQSVGVKPLYIGRGLPQRLMTLLTYSNVKSYTAAAPTITTQIYRLASLFDPDQTGVGGQPGWFDIIKVNYRAYIVRGVHVDLQFVNDAAETARCQYIVTNLTSGTLSTTFDWSELGAKRSGGFLLGQNGSDRIRRSFYVNNAQAAGLSATDMKLTQSNPLTAGVGSSPTVGPTLQLRVETPDGSGTHNVQIRVRFKFYCEFFGRDFAQGGDT